VLERLAQESNLKEVDGKVRVNFGGEPESERRLDAVADDDGVEQFVDVVECQVTVVQKDPATVLH